MLSFLPFSCSSCVVVSSSLRLLVIIINFGSSTLYYNCIIKACFRVPFGLVFLSLLLADADISSVGQRFGFLGRLDFRCAPMVVSGPPTRWFGIATIVKELLAV